MGPALAALELLRNELLLFAAIGLLIGGLDDLLIDLVYAARRLWRSLTVYSRIRRMTARDLPPAGAAGPIAVFVPAWDEADVIVPMLRGCLEKWRDDDVQIFVGVYANDRPTIDAVVDLIARHGGDRVLPVVNHRDGPTTKADCLNQLWHAMRRWERREGRDVLAVVLHDAEDVVHKDALRVIGLLAPRFALVQLPVLPLTSARSRWVAGHYCDEFAEAHGKSLAVREAVGAALPSAGVGCGFNRAALGRIAAARGDLPFDASSLTEDYELGLLLGDEGGRGVMVRMRDADGQVIATREYFPDTLSAAIRQKARWTVGIALAGWDRLGWTGGWRERWMRLRDRRAALAALILLTAYVGLILSASVNAGAWLIGRPLSPLPPPLPALLAMTGVILVWRLLVRMIFVWSAYGPVEALRSVPRTFIANFIAMLAARRAVGIYVRHLRGEALAWDKTAHRFPEPVLATATAR
ncbi:glycosyl transferase family protein [Sphingobium nicotianae]|uniref:Glycosyl transferase family protein n=1 Tax=Sphingobium nicotianae TaxID=2782607 RepID=A0A9X1D9T7_9SPHN|nr:glycosyl transferase family protein [Sphingobium nicotianae]MBT2186007.1 glycosyl transferase family protein [Sphingobium nicotianae]